jgi:anti-sigma factor (TIGR02949 family)
MAPALEGSETEPMTCRDVREHLADLSRGHLSAELAANVRVHLNGCPACSQALRGEERLRALVRGHAPRYTAPPALQARIRAALREAERPPRTAWRDWARHHPWLTGALVGATAAVAIVWAGGAWLARDPVARLVAAAVDEHVEYARETMHRPVPDAEELLRTVQSEAGFRLGPLFRGDAEAPLILAAITEVRGTRAVALVYRNGPERYTTLLVMPGADAAIPAEDRLAIENFTPHHRVASSKQVLYWKQRDVAYLLVSDLDQSDLSAMFLKVRKAA